MEQEPSDLQRPRAGGPREQERPGDLALKGSASLSAPRGGPGLCHLAACVVHLKITLKRPSHPLLWLTVYSGQRRRRLRCTRL